MDKQIVLGTSLAPKKDEKQQQAVASWSKTKFKIISCNTQEEIDEIKEYYPTVEFVPIKRDARTIAGKALPYIHDILNVVADEAEEVCGFINADIILEDISEQLYDFLLEESKDSLIFMRRNEINNIEDIKRVQWTIHFDGIDMFVIDKKNAKTFYNDDFFVQSLWDVCLHIKCLLLGVRVKELINPICFHIKHTQKWDFNLMNSLIEDFYRKYFGNSSNAYKRNMKNYYSLILNRAERICYSPEGKKHFLVIDKELGKNTIYRLEHGQLFEEIPKGKGKDKFDFEIYLNKTLCLNNYFFQEINYLYEKYRIGEMHFNSYFVSTIDGVERYNELNRCIEILDEANEKLGTRVIVKTKGSPSEVKKFFLPMVDSYIDLQDASKVRLIQLKANIYVAPAGIRANEWLMINQKELEGVQVVGFLDKDNSKTGQKSNGIEVFTYDVLKKNMDDYQIVLASKNFNKVVEQELLKQVSKDKIINASYILHMDEKGNIYYLST